MLIPLMKVDIFWQLIPHKIYHVKIIADRPTPPHLRQRPRRVTHPRLIRLDDYRTRILNHLRWHHQKGNSAFSCRRSEEWIFRILIKVHSATSRPRNTLSLSRPRPGMISGNRNISCLSGPRKSSEMWPEILNKSRMLLHLAKPLWPSGRKMLPFRKARSRCW